MSVTIRQRQLYRRGAKLAAARQKQAVKSSSLPHEVLIRIASGQVGVREEEHNRGKEILKYWEATTYPWGAKNREPWCAAFVVWCVRQAWKAGAVDLTETQLPRSAAVREWLSWARKLNLNVIHSGPLAGDIVVFLPHFSHIGIVEGVYTDHVNTIEGNTDDQGGREGVEVARRRRELRLCGSFIRLPWRSA
jgi:uncharacterized protein YwbE